MKNWVRSYLLEEYERFFEQLGGDPDLNKAQMEEIAKMPEDDEEVYLELSCKVKIQFRDFVFGGKGWYVAAVFGSVLADLPKEVFMRIVERTNVVYTFTLNQRAEANTFKLDGEEDVNQRGRNTVVTFPYQAVFMPIAALRGTIVHKLVHVYLLSQEIASNDAMEAEADKVAREWGFQEETAAMRKYYEQDELEEQQYPTNNDATESLNVGK